MSENVALVRRLIEGVWNEGRAEVAAEVVHEAYGEEARLSTGVVGPQAALSDRQAVDAALASARFEIDRLLADGDTVVAFWAVSGLSRSETFTVRDGRQRPKRLHAHGVSVHRLEAGRVRSSERFWPVPVEQAL